MKLKIQWLISNVQEQRSDSPEVWEAGISQLMLLGAHRLLDQCFPRSWPKESNPNAQQVSTNRSPSLL